ncbi:hypothetical protein evm_014521 [Chilo suppressalis]|nr:hypothetical protein evm_014521 [Chilo suppressalis]
MTDYSPRPLFDAVKITLTLSLSFCIVNDRMPLFVKFKFRFREHARIDIYEKWCRDQDLDWKEDCWSGIEIGQTLNNCTGLSPIVGCTKLYDII